MVTLISGLRAAKVPSHPMTLGAQTEGDVQRVRQVGVGRRREWCAVGGTACRAGGRDSVQGAVSSGNRLWGRMRRVA